MSLPLPPKRPPMPPRYTPAPPKWEVSKLKFDALYLHCDGQVLTRQEVFRLIGELERIGASL